MKGETLKQAVRAHRIGLLLSMLAILSGFVLGGVFGAWEDSLKGGLADSAGAVLEDVYGGDEAASKKVVDKAWVYYKRAHMHWGAIGAATLSLSILLAAMMGSVALARLASLAMGLGAVLYPVFWLLAGPRLGPGAGRPGWAAPARPRSRSSGWRCPRRGRCCSAAPWR